MTPTTSPAAATLTYKVTGSPADVAYGPSGSQIAGQSPMTITAKLGDAQYYAVRAQLQGSGSVTVEILINDKVISSGEASDGYNIANAEICKATGEWGNCN